MVFRFSFKYFLLSVILFLVEVVIATLLRDIYFVRAFLGDVLVVILVYTFMMAFFEPKNKALLLFCVFLFAVLVEVSQYFKLAEKLGFAEGSVAYIVLGNYFSWRDILCYAVGCLLVFLFINKKWRRN